MKPYLLADDLSGALEVGASFREHGHRVTVPLTEEAKTGDTLQVITTETRNLPPGQAGAIVAQVLREQAFRGRQLIFKKTDSTLRGPLVAELCAISDFLRPPLIVFCPANPEAGRTVRAGMLHVNGVPLAETDFRNDPIWPARTSRLEDFFPPELRTATLALEALRTGKTAEVFNRCKSDGTPLLIAEAETSADLAEIVRATRAGAPGTVFVGANGLARALAAADAGNAAMSPVEAAPALPHVKSLLVVCGSRHPASHRQVEHLVTHAHAKLFTLDGTSFSPRAMAVKIQMALRESAVAALRLDPTANQSPADLLSKIESLAAVFALEASPEAFFFTGGETARAACASLGGASLEILAPWDHAVVAATLHREGQDSRLVFTKPGGYGHDPLLSRLWAHMTVR